MAFPSPIRHSRAKITRRKAVSVRGHICFVVSLAVLLEFFEKRRLTVPSTLALHHRARNPSALIILRAKSAFRRRLRLASQKARTPSCVS